MPRQARAIATRETIVRAAGVVFSRTSYSASTMAEVIEEAGVTQGAIYFHFTSKQDLALEVIKRQHRISIGAGEDFLRDGTPGLEAIVLLSAELAHQITTNAIVRGGLRLSTESADLFPADEVRQPYVDWTDATERLLRRASQEGDVKEDIDCGVAAKVVISAFTGTQMVSQAVSGRTDLSERLEEMWALLIPALVAPGRAAAFENVARLVRSRMAIAKH